MSEKRTQGKVDEILSELMNRGLGSGTDKIVKAKRELLEELEKALPDSPYISGGVHEIVYQRCLADCREALKKALE